MHRDRHAAAPSTRCDIVLLQHSADAGSVPSSAVEAVHRPAAVAVAGRSATDVAAASADVLRLAVDAERSATAAFVAAERSAIAEPAAAEPAGSGAVVVVVAN